MQRFTFLLTVFVLSSIIFTQFSCNSGGNASAKKAEQQNEVLPMLPIEMIQNLFNKCEAVEVTFYDLPMSMSSNANNTKSFVAFIKNEGIKSNQLKKKAVGIMNFNINGDIYLDAEIFVDAKKTFTPYFRFKKDGKTYYNQMSDQAVGVFTNPMRQ